MQDTKCRFQSRVSSAQLAEALQEARCYHCSVTARELMLEGKLLEVCGEEHLCGMPGEESDSVAIALCPDCHYQAHLDAHRRLVPCHVKARRSREWIDEPASRRQTEGYGTLQPAVD